jgi:hypothetical protein
MGGLTLPILWAQASGAGVGTQAGSASSAGVISPAAAASLAFRRWCAGLTLSSPQTVPSLDGLWIFLGSLAVLLLLALIVQGPALALRQFLDVPGHIALVQRATRRVWRAGRLVAAAIAFTVLAWTGGQTLGFVADKADKGKADLTTLTRSRGRLELAFEQGMLAGLTPLRDVAGLGDNLPLLICAVYLLFRASSGMLPPPPPGPGEAGVKSPATRGTFRPPITSGWGTTMWGCGALYILYRLVARASGVDLPLGGCLVVEALIIPLMMSLCDGFLLAWILTEIRKAGFDNTGVDQSHPAYVLELMPAAALACLLALPARYISTLVFLIYQHLPTSIATTSLGRYIRWQFGWGLVDLQGASLIVLGIVGVVAWSRGSLGEAVVGFRYLLQKQGGHLVAAIAMASTAAGLLGGLIYPVMLLLPPAGWVLPAADSYSHYLTLPVGLWTVAAMIDLMERSVPAARLVRTVPQHLASEAEGEAGAAEPTATAAE